MKGLKIFLFALIVAFVSVGYALPNDTTKKTETVAETETKTIQEATVNVFGIYSILKMNAPEVFTGDAKGTKVYLYGEHKDEAYIYLTKHKDAKEIYVSNECYKDETIAIVICKPERTAVIHNKQPNKITAISTNGFNKIAKKWVYCV